MASRPDILPPAEPGASERTVAPSASSSEWRENDSSNQSGAPCPSAGGTATEVLNDPGHAIRFQCLADVIYHGSRENFFDSWAKILTGFQVFLQTGSIFVFVTGNGILAGVAAIVSALAGVVLLVLDPTKLARDHRSIRSRYHQILAEIEETEHSDEQCRRWRAQKWRLGADEPVTFRALAALSFNAAVDSIYTEKEAEFLRLQVPLSDQRFANWREFRGKIYKPKHERDEDRLTSIDFTS